MNAQRRTPATPDGLVVERAREAQWRAVRDVRLAALAESPSAFGSTLEREQTYDAARWRQWTRAAVFLASVGGTPVGIAAGVPGDTEASRQLVAVWVSPDVRGRGVSSQLLERVEEWAVSDGARCLHLWLARGNVPARRLYERRGYVDTGRVQPLPSNPAVLEDQMVLTLHR
ncbi:MAG: GNAT family N-acetyltransferase [Kineosporiaceae bacterium]